MEWFHHIDLLLLRKVNQEIISSFLDCFFPIMAAPVYFIAPLVLIGLWLLYRGGFRERFFVGVVLVTLFVGDAGIVGSLKKMVNRPRPHEAVEGVRLVTREGVTISHPIEEVSKGRSFPSGHVCNNVALAMIVVAFYGKRYRWLYGWVFLMMWNRVYLGSHYPSDVIFSVLISIIYTKLLLGLSRIVFWRLSLSRL